MRYKIFLLAVCQTVHLCCGYIVKHLFEWSHYLLGEVSQESDISLLTLSTSLLEQTSQSIVPELGTVGHSYSLLHLFRLAFLSFRSFCFESLADCSCMLYRFSCIYVNFTNYCFKQIFIVVVEIMAIIVAKSRYHCLHHVHH